MTRRPDLCYNKTDLAARKGGRHVTYLRRLIWYIASRLLIVCCVLGLLIMAFYFSMNATNIYIILKDGMAKRAQVVMMGEEADLTSYFSQACLDRDQKLNEALNGQSAYQNNYNITGFDHRISLDSFWCWPWDDRAEVVITERIPAIDGKLKASVRDAAATGTGLSSPKWPTTQYTVHLSRENGQWHVKNLTPTRVINAE